jgi:predicted ribosome quality control (RQC) complex YloA/Tae2 family protein
VDPEVSPIEAAQQAYKKAKKLRRGAEVLRGLLGQAESQVAYAESIFVALDQLEGTDGDIEVLREIASELGIQGEQVSGSRYLDAFGTKQVQAGGDSNMYAKNVKNVGRGKKKAQQQKSGSAAQGKNQRKNLLDGILQMQRTTDSSTVLVGRSNIQNERITFSIAKDHELWFHARGVAGSHVLLRAQPGQDADPDDIQFAADLAVYYSKAREGSEVPVDCISPKRIRKMGSAGPGMVWYEEAKVMWGNPKRIRELIASIHVGL